ncbi:MAG: hypothetical protein WCO23_04220 [bacterium]
MVSIKQEIVQITIVAIMKRQIRICSDVSGDVPRKQAIHRSIKNTISRIKTPSVITLSVIPGQYGVNSGPCESEISGFPLIIFFEKKIIRLRGPRNFIALWVFISAEKDCPYVLVIVRDDAHQSAMIDAHIQPKFGWWLPKLFMINSKVVEIATSVIASAKSEPMRYQKYFIMPSPFKMRMIYWSNIIIL